MHVGTHIVTCFTQYVYAHIGAHTRVPRVFGCLCSNTHLHAITGICTHSLASFTSKCSHVCVQMWAPSPQTSPHACAHMCTLRGTHAPHVQTCTLHACTSTPAHTHGVATLLHAHTRGRSHTRTQTQKHTFTKHMKVSPADGTGGGEHSRAGRHRLCRTISP